ncbi:MAG: hypothetical protein ABIL09_02460, partial [Gemmatimonadota bacterium]
MRRPLHLSLLSSVLILGVVLRWVGLTRGSSDFVLPEQRRAGVSRAFYTFHPDERTLLQAAVE